MSIINDIQNSHELLKSFLYSLILLPFWYVNIYFFHYEFYQQNEFILIVALCLCLHISSLLLFGFGLLQLYDDKQRIDGTEDSFGTMSMSLFFWFIVIDSIAYAIKFFNGKVMYFFTFLCVFFAPLALGLLIYLLKLIFSKK